MFKIMKCYYKYCPYGREVEKEKAIKINNKYYHKNILLLNIHCVKQILVFVNT